MDDEHTARTNWWSLCAGNSPVPDEFPTQRPVTQSFDVFFDLRLNKQLNKQPPGWWFETPPWSLWHQYDEHNPKRLIGYPLRLHMVFLRFAFNINIPDKAIRIIGSVFRISFIYTTAIAWSSLYEWIGLKHMFEIGSTKPGQSATKSETCA